jgi:hypothetical protein
MKRRIMAILLLLIGFLGGLLADSLPGPNILLARQDPSYQEVVAAREFRLVDQNGRMRFSLQLDERGEFTLSLYDAQGALRGSFGMTAEGRPAISLGTGGKAGGQNP